MFTARGTDLIRMIVMIFTVEHYTYPPKKNDSIAPEK